MTSVPRFPKSRAVKYPDSAAVEIPLTRGQVAIVSPEDALRLGAFRWFALPRASGRCAGFYAARKGTLQGRLTIYMHREVLGAPSGLEVDHRNNNTLDNRRENLRLCTHQQNMGGVVSNRCRSKYGFVGVSRRRNGGRFYGFVNAANKRYETVSFTCPILAAAARDVLASRLHGDFARLNFQWIPIN